MQKFDVQIALEGLREARESWVTAQREFHDGYNKVLARLLHDAARNYMSAEDVAKSLGVSAKTVRNAMRLAGLDPKSGKRVLSKRAADALAGNAELLGIKPHEMDLTSPLAYLPMGEQMKRALRDSETSQVTELPNEFGDAEQMAQKLTDAGLLIEDARAWVAHVSGNAQL